MSFTFFPNLPNAPDYPGDDQPGMQTNAASTNSILAIDHVSFNAPNGGTHKQVTFSSENTPSAPIDPISIAFTAAGTADYDEYADLRYINGVGTMQVLPIRAWCACNTGASNSFVGSQKINIASVMKSAVGQFVITIPSGVVNGPNFGVLLTNAGNLLNSYSITGNVVTVHFLSPSSSFADPGYFTFAALQI